MSDNSLGTFLNQSFCWFNATYTVANDHGCTITNDMVAWLNLTAGSSNYIQAYCLNPPSNDNCPFGYCPNGDIAGILVRVANYVSNLCLAIVILYNPEEVAESFWAQLLTLYSLIITTILSIAQGQLTKFHAIISAMMIGSPLTLYLTSYSVLSLFGVRHRLSATVGRGKYLARSIVLVASLSWIILSAYIFLAQNPNRFSQHNCDDVDASEFLVKDFLASAFIIFIKLAKVAPGLVSVVCLPIVATMVAWGIAIWLQRKQIWAQGETYSVRLMTVWRVVGDCYPFIHFMSVVFIPFSYWCITVEIGLIDSRDEQFSLSFGQILGMFVIVPPLLSVIKLLPRLVGWIPNLAWVRYLTCRPQLSDKQSRFGSGFAHNANTAAQYEMDNKPYGGEDTAFEGLPQRGTRETPVDLWNRDGKGHTRSPSPHRRRRSNDDGLGGYEQVALTHDV